MNIVKVQLQCEIPYSVDYQQFIHTFKNIAIITKHQLDLYSQRIQQVLPQNNSLNREQSKKYFANQWKQKWPTHIAEEIQERKFQINYPINSEQQSKIHYDEHKPTIQPKNKHIKKSQPIKAIKQKANIQNLRKQIIKNQTTLHSQRKTVLQKKIEHKKAQLKNIKIQPSARKSMRTLERLSRQKLDQSNSQNNSFNIRLRGRNNQKQNNHDNTFKNIKNKKTQQTKPSNQETPKNNKSSQFSKTQEKKYEDHFDPNKFLLANSNINKPLRQKFIKNVLSQVPGRRQQASTIFDFIVRSENGSSSPLCIHGNTGCGKTSMITKIIQFMCQQFPSKMSTAYLNCMSMYNVNHVYGGILNKLFGFKQKKSQRALNDLFLLNSNGDKKKLQQKFKKKNGQNLIKMQDVLKTKIIVLDQIDHFIKDQSFIYNLLQWTHLKGSKIILILISNVIDLSLKLQGKIQSRMKFQSIVFKPYSFSAIQQIFKFKYPQAEQVFQKNAICFLCRKVASINSDIRLMQKIYGEVMENWKGHSEKKKKINIEHIQNSLFLTGQVNTTKLLKGFEPLLKVLHNVKQQGQITAEVSMKYFLCSKNIPTSQQIFLLLCQLKDFGLISINENTRNADAIFQGFGIKVYEQLHLMCSQDL